MDKSDNTSKSRAGRNRVASRTRSASSPPKLADIPISTPNRDAQEDVIEEERARLMTTHTLLSCAAIAMDDQEVGPIDGPHYQTIVTMARDLINESINRLDSVSLGRVMGAQKREAGEALSEEQLEVGLRGKYEVRGEPVEYVC